jgi:hypothetical protein
MTKDFSARLAVVANTPAGPAPAKAEQVQAAPVKMTVEVDRAAYQFVRAFPEAMGLPDALGLNRVPTVEVYRALLQLLEEDQDLAERVAERMKANLAP